jgi:hypothetical protein
MILQSRGEEENVEQFRYLGTTITTQNFDSGGN